MTVDLVCDVCGSDLEETMPRYSQRRGVSIAPCATCVEAARNEGFATGHEAGHAAGYDEGLSAGEQAVRDDVKSMLQIVKEESCAELKGGAVSNHA